MKLKTKFVPWKLPCASHSIKWCTSRHVIKEFWCVCFGLVVDALSLHLFPADSPASCTPSKSSQRWHMQKEKQPKWCKKRDNWPTNWPWSIPLLITATSSFLGGHCAPATLTQHRGDDGRLISRFIYANARHVLKCGMSAGLTGSWQDIDKSVWTEKALQWWNTMKWDVVDKIKFRKNKMKLFFCFVF